MKYQKPLNNIILELNHFNNKRFYYFNFLFSKYIVYKIEVKDQKIDFHPDFFKYTSDTNLICFSYFLKKILVGNNKNNSNQYYFFKYYVLDVIQSNYFKKYFAVIASNTSNIVNINNVS